MEKLGWSEKKLLPKVIPAMCKSDFWQTNDEQKIKSPLFYLKTPTKAIADYTQMVKNQFQKGFWDSSQNELQFEDYEEIWKLLDRLVENDLEIFSFGLILQRTDLRLLPQIEPFFNENRQTDLNRNQFSGLELGDECLIFAMIDQEKWYGVVTKRGVGWVLAQEVGIGDQAEILEFSNTENRITMIEPECQLGTKRQKLLAGMGCSFPKIKEHSNQVLIPTVNQKGKLMFEAATVFNGGIKGELSATNRNFLCQVFKYLGTPYAWGDRDFVGLGIDCSRLVQNSLLTLGIIAPRYSQEQFFAGVNQVAFENLNQAEILNKLQKVSPGSLLFTKSHVMIYLGIYNLQPYIIHALYSFQELICEGEKECKVKRVVVSDLQLGQGTANNSLLARLTGMVEIF